MTERSLHTTNFGLWSERKLDEVTALLDRLDVRYEVTQETDLSQDRLESWCAWDAEADNPHIGFHLDIWTEDLPKVGNRIVEIFPERRFEGSGSFKL